MYLFIVIITCIYLLFLNLCIFEFMYYLLFLNLCIYLLASERSEQDTLSSVQSRIADIYIIYI